MNRRAFLKSTALVAAGAAFLPAIVSESRPIRTWAIAPRGSMKRANNVVVLYEGGRIQASDEASILEHGPHTIVIDATEDCRVDESVAVAAAQMICERYA